MSSMIPWLVVLACNDPQISKTPHFGGEFSADLDGDGQQETILVDYEQIKIDALVTAVPKIQIHEPMVEVMHLDRREPHKELVVRAVDVNGVGVWHVLLYLEDRAELYTIEVTTPPEILGDGVLRTRFASCGETVVTDWARAGNTLTQTRTERLGIYNAALCSN